MQHERSHRFHASTIAGPEGAFVDDEGQPLFLPHVELWLKAMRTKLTQWSTRLLAQVSLTTVQATFPAGQILVQYPKHPVHMHVNCKGWSLFVVSICRR